MKKIKIANRVVGQGQPCFIVAEMGINHNGDINSAKKMIDVAKECGVDAIKFQTFKAEEFVSNPDGTYSYKSQGREVTESMLGMFKRYEFSERRWKDIFNYCKKNNIICFSTPQNLSDLDFLLKIVDLPIIKVGSDDLTNLELLKYYASKNRPMIISAGMAFISEIEDAVNIIREEGNNDLVVLHCVSSYPPEPEEVSLKKMLTIRRAFNVIVGFSDHTIGNTAAIVAVALGAKVIEKHFTLDKNLPGPDHWFSSDPEELFQLIQAVRYTEKSLGNYIIKPTPKEMEMRKIARRSIVAARDITAGGKIAKDMIEFKRPGTGLPPKFLKYILNKKARKKIKKNQLITFREIF